MHTAHRLGNIEKHKKNSDRNSSLPLIYLSYCSMQKQCISFDQTKIIANDEVGGINLKIIESASKFKRKIAKMRRELLANNTKHMHHR